ncbi:MAG: TIGR03564 family F420-dependent LLM class oxidoreductase [Gammaproteobacteria bacterium]
MHLGIMIGSDRQPRTIDEIIRLVKAAEDAGLDSAWMANIFGFDAIMSMTLAARATKTITVGTAVTPTYPRHPAALAQQAVTAAAASNNRFILGIGLSHQRVIEGVYGLSYDKPAKHMREYLDVLIPLLGQEAINYEGEQYTTRGIQLAAPGATDVPVVIAALGPVMLRLAGRLADGTNTWMVGPKTMETHIAKTINAAAAEVGKRAPMIVGNFPVMLTNNADAVRTKLAEMLEIYGELPSYRSMLDKEGYDSPVDAALIGDEKTLRARISEIKSSGVTDFGAAVYDLEDGAFDRTLAFLATI